MLDAIMAGEHSTCAYSSGSYSSSCPSVVEGVQCHWSRLAAFRFEVVWMSDMSNADAIAEWLEEHAADEEYSTLFHDVTHGTWIRVPVPHLLAEAVRSGAWMEPMEDEPAAWSDDELAAEYSEALDNLRTAGRAMVARVAELREDRDAAAKRYHGVGYAQAVADSRCAAGTRTRGES